MCVQIALLEGSITATEREIREIANTSAIRDGSVDMEISKKKRRLNADLDSLVDRMQVKREEFMVLDDVYVHARNCFAISWPLVR